jgi:hypothetical protein
VNRAKYFCQAHELLVIGAIVRRWWGKRLLGGWGNFWEVVASSRSWPRLPLWLLLLEKPEKLGFCGWNIGHGACAGPKDAAQQER